MSTDKMTDEEIDLSDCPEITPEKFAKAVVRQGLPVEKNKAQGLYGLIVMFWSDLSSMEGTIKPRSITCCEHIWKLIIKSIDG